MNDYSHSPRRRVHHNHHHHHHHHHARRAPPPKTSGILDGVRHNVQAAVHEISQNVEEVRSNMDRLATRVHSMNDATRRQTHNKSKKKNRMIHEYLQTQPRNHGRRHRYASSPSLLSPNSPGGAARPTATVRRNNNNYTRNSQPMTHSPIQQARQPPQAPMTHSPLQARQPIQGPMTHSPLQTPQLPVRVPAPVRSAPPVPVATVCEGGLEAIPIAHAQIILDNDVRQHFLCPITGQIMHDPVVAADGHTYERAAIERHLSTRNESPVTGQPLPHQHLIPNHVVKNLLLSQQQQQQQHG